MKRLFAMKLRIVFLVLVLALTAAIPAHANSIPIDGSRALGIYNPGGVTGTWIWMSPSGVLGNTFDGRGALTNGGTFSFNVTGFAGFTGSNYAYMSGGLYAAWKGTVLSGAVSNVAFNSSTGIWTAKFTGYGNSTYMANGIYTQHLNIVRGGIINGHFYSDGSVGNGNIKKTVPEPETLGLLGTRAFLI